MQGWTGSLGGNPTPGCATTCRTRLGNAAYGRCGGLQEGSRTPARKALEHHYVMVKERKEDIVRGLESGANDYITKPFDPQEFRARIMVGIRVVELQQQLISAERSRVLAQAAGEVAHENNQPLTVLLGTTQLLMMHTSKEDENRQGVEDLFKAAKINAIIKKGSDIRRYATQPYIDGVDIADFDAASADEF